MNDPARALAEYTTVNLAYVDEAGDPQVCALFFALTEEGSLVFVSSRSTRHGRALAVGGRVAFTAQAEGQSWTTIAGVQGGGVCAVVSGPALAEAQASYARRFAFVAEDPVLRAALASAEHWEIKPDWLRLIDNTQGFGHKQEWSTALPIERTWIG
ncbi:pyridoxamine 5'-phosphate oxidase [Streptomyces sp. NPDC001002]